MKRKTNINKPVSITKIKDNTTALNENHKRTHKFILFFGALVLYGWTYTFDFGLDDNYIVTALNSVENKPSGFFTIFSSTFAVTDYRPVSVLSFWLERLLFGEINPSYSHFINVLFFGFLLTRIYLFVTVSKFYADTQKLLLLAFLTAVIFLVHPNHVSVVANIKSRDSLLSMIFGIMSAIQFIRFFDDRKWWRILLGLLLIIAGFLSKMDCYVFIVTPFFIVLLFRKIKLKELLMFLFFSFLLYQIVFGVREFFLSDHKQFENLKPLLLDQSRSPLAGNDSLINRFSLSCITMLYYIKFLFVPWGYYFYYGYNQIPLLSLFHPVNFLAVFIFITIGLLCWWMFNKNRIYIFCFTFFLIAIAYASNLPVIVAGIVMDRYSFIASLGFCIAFSAFLIDSNLISVDVRMLRKNKLLIFLLIFYSIFTVYRTSAWKDNLTLFKRDIPHLDKSVHANRFIGVYYLNKTLFEENDKATQDSFMLLSESYINRALAISDKSPDVLEAKGICNLYNGKNRAALSCFYKCKNLDSNYLTAINYIGVSYRNLQITDSAYFYFNYVMQREKEFGYSAENLLELLVNNNRLHEADSLIKVFNSRFPDNTRLKSKMEELNLNMPNN